MSPCTIRTLEPLFRNVVKSPERKRAAKTSLANCKLPWKKSSGPLNLRWICAASKSSEWRSSFSRRRESTSSRSGTLDAGGGVKATIEDKPPTLARNLPSRLCSTLLLLMIQPFWILILALSDEPIARSMHCEEILWLFGIGLELLAQAHQMRIHRPGSWKILVSPNFFQNSIATE